MRPSLLHFGGQRSHNISAQNDPKHAVEPVENYIKRAKYHVVQNWPAQSPDIIPIENLLQELKIGTLSVHVVSLSKVSKDTPNYNCTSL